LLVAERSLQCFAFFPTYGKIVLSGINQHLTAKA